MKFCDAEGCCAQATEKVRVSVDKPHDDTRHYCYSCHEVYLVGVQHGRHHEAAIHNTVPDRESSQIKPHGKLWKQLKKSREERQTEKI